MCVTSLRLSLFDQGQNLHAMIVISLTSFSQRDASCGPVEQSGSKVCFQIRNGARGLAGSDVHAVRRGGEAPGFDDAHKDAHVLKYVHAELQMRVETATRDK
jgi:hypothetical protein